MSRRLRTVATCAVALAVSACAGAPAPATPAPARSRPAAPAVASTMPPSDPPVAFLLPGEAAALPDLPPGIPFEGHLLIAENSSHSRIVEIDPSGQVTWTFATTAAQMPHPLGPPDDTFYTADGSAILLSSESGQGVLAIARGTGAVLWQLGSYYRRGDTANLFNSPDDAVPAPDGTVWVADIRNCRLVHLTGSTGALLLFRRTTMP